MNSMQYLELIISLSVQTTIVIGSSFGLTLLTSSQRAHCRIWTCCFVAILTLTAAAFVLPHLRIIYPWGAVDRHAGAALLEAGRTTGQFALAIWSSGAGVLAVITVIRWWKLSRYLNNCVEINPEEIAIAESDSLEHRGRQVHLVVGEDAETPSCWQFQRPVIVLPPFVLSLESAWQEFIIRHEVAHLRLGHPLQLFLQRIVEILFWFHPLVWWASRRAAVAREFACDDAALRSRSDGAEYLRALMFIVEHLRGSRGAAGLLTFGARTSVLTLRARRLVANATTSTTPTVRVPTSYLLAGLAVTAVLCAFVWAPVDLQASPLNTWSPWPRWSAHVLHDFGIEARDFEGHECRFDGFDEYSDRSAR